MMRLLRLRPALGAAPQVSLERRRDLEALGFGRDTRVRAVRTGGLLRRWWS